MSPHGTVHSGRLQQSNAGATLELRSGNSFLNAQGGVQVAPQWQPTRSGDNAANHQKLGSVLSSSASRMDGADSEILAAGPPDWDADFRPRNSSRVYYAAR